jgi:ABC-type polysaccharide/polyol phosphate transport system ATPase subunit
MPAAISIENLSKRYTVDHEAQRGGYRTLRESLVDAASYPLRRLRGQHSTTREDFWALKDVSFEVQPGEVVGIIGRNGAGKSTLLKVLSRITKPTKGRVTLNGRVGSLLEVGTGFHPELTGRENIYLNGSILGMSRREIRRKFDEIVEFAEIDKFVDTPVKRYSSGMYVRLAFSVAAHLEPEILIIDEVLAVGDAAFQKKCLEKVGSLASEGGTILLVSHNLPTIASLATGAVLLSEGKSIVSGDVETVLAAYSADGSCGEAVFHRQTPHLRWDGFTNRDLVHLSPGDDLCLDFSMATGSRSFTGLHVDVALHNEANFLVVHARSPVVGDGFQVPSHSLAQFKYRFERPHLAPGMYRLTVYAYTDTEVLLWVDNIPACHIDSHAHFGISDILPKLRGAVVPPFTVSAQVL